VYSWVLCVEPSDFDTSALVLDLVFRRVKAGSDAGLATAADIARAPSFAIYNPRDVSDIGRAVSDCGKEFPLSRSELCGTFTVAQPEQMDRIGRNCDSVCKSMSPA
jgi:hypothetical protein